MLHWSRIFARVMDNKDIDVVSIATPNHWHALSVIWACQAGKDVYVEKPGSHNIWEGRKMVEAAQKYDRIVQHGVQLRSSPAVNEAIELLRDGYIGRVYMARGLVFRWRADIGDQRISHLFPKGWITICGPVRLPSGPLQKTWFITTGTGTGIMEMVMWATRVFTKPIFACGDWMWAFPQKSHPWEGNSSGMTARRCPRYLHRSITTPKRIRSYNLRFVPGAPTPKQGATVGNIFYGDKGILVVDGYDKYKTYLGQNREPGKSGDDGGESGSEMDRGAGGTDGHFTNFIEAVRKHDASILNAPVETAHLSSGSGTPW